MWWRSHSRIWLPRKVARIKNPQFVSPGERSVHVRAGGFDLQNDVSSGGRRLLEERETDGDGECPRMRARKVAATRSVCTVRRRDTFPLSGRRRRPRPGRSPRIAGGLPVEMDLRRPRDISYNATYGSSAF